MKWCSQPYSYLAMTKPSEYSDESRLEVRPAHSRYLFVYPFVKTRAWYALPADERWKIMQEHIKVGKRVPGHRPQHVVLVRARRPGVRRRLRGRRPGALPRPRAAAAHDGGLRVHEARHADVHVRVDLGRARALRASTGRRSPRRCRPHEAAAGPRGARSPRSCSPSPAAAGTTAATAPPPTPATPSSRSRAGCRSRSAPPRTRSRPSSPKAGGKTLQQLADEIGGGPEMGLAGSVFLAGQDNRVAFGVIDDNAGFLYGKTALYVAPTPDSRPRARTWRPPTCSSPTRRTAPSRRPPRRTRSPPSTPRRCRSRSRASTR